jgi:hypothetical protein
MVRGEERINHNLAFSLEGIAMVKDHIGWLLDGHRQSFSIPAQDQEAGGFILKITKGFGNGCLAGEENRQVEPNRRYNKDQMFLGQHQVMNHEVSLLGQSIELGELSIRLHSIDSQVGTRALFDPECISFAGLRINFRMGGKRYVPGQGPIEIPTTLVREVLRVDSGRMSPFREAE